MNFSEPNTVEPHLRYLLVRGASCRPPQLFSGFTSGGMQSDLKGRV